MPRSRRVPNASIEQGGTQLRTPNGLRRCASVLAEYCWVSAPLADPGSGPDRALRSTAVRQAHRRGETSATVRRPKSFLVSLSFEEHFGVHILKPTSSGKGFVTAHVTDHDALGRK